MKKEKIVRFIAVLLVIGMMSAVSCGSAEDETGTTETTQTSQTTQPSETSAAASVDDPSYDIEDVLEAAGLEAALPADIDYDIEETSSTAVSIYLEAAEDAGLGGVVGDIMAFDEGDTSYDVFPDYQVIGEKNGITYVTLYATDLQYDPNDAQQKEDYERLTYALKAFRIN